MKLAFPGVESLANHVVEFLAYHVERNLAYYAFSKPRRARAIEMSLVDWRRQTAVNLDGVFLSVKYAVLAMRRAGGGSIATAFANRRTPPFVAQ